MKSECVAACEASRVWRFVGGAESIFSQMKDMFGEKRASALADMLQAPMMLRYHKRAVGCKSNFARNFVKVTSFVSGS